MTLAVTMEGAVPPRPSYQLPDEVIERTAYWLREFSLAWHSEVPVKIHEGLRSLLVDGGGAPAFTKEFLEFIDRPCKRKWCHNLNCDHDNADEYLNPRRRTKRAFRRLRKVAPREWDVVYLMCAYGLSVKDVADRLTARAIRLNKPERYGEAAVLLLAVSGIDKVVTYW